MKKLFLFVVVYLISIQSFSQVSVEIVDLKVNQLPISNNQINFNSANWVNVKFKIKLSTVNGDPNNILGNLFVYTKDVFSSQITTQRDFRTVTFVVNNPPFVPQTIYTFEADVDVNLIANQFYNTGGVLYANYRNTSNTNYFSQDLTIIGGTNINTSPDLLPNTICCNQTIRYGDKPSLISASYIDPEATFEKRWIKVVPGDYPFQGTPNFASDNSVNSLDPDHLFETSTYLRSLGTTGPNTVANHSNQVTITVVPTPFLSNEISTNAILIEDNKYEVGQGMPITFSGQLAKVNLNVFSNPFHLPLRYDPKVNCDSYVWQVYSSGRWLDLSNSNLPNLESFTPPTTNPKNFKVRRIAHYQGISNVSNIIEIYVRNSTSNVICCSQFLGDINGIIAMPELIIGSIPTLELPYTLPTGWHVTSYQILYQWESQSRTSPWMSVLNANSKDYLPPSSDKNYRRKATINWIAAGHSLTDTGSYVTYSNVINISNDSRNTFASREINDNENFYLYPNPSLDNVTLSGLMGCQNYKFRIYELTGKEMKVLYRVVNNDELYFDISNLTSGLYLLAIEDNLGYIVTKKFLKK